MVASTEIGVDAWINKVTYGTNFRLPEILTDALDQPFTTCDDYLEANYIIQIKGGEKAPLFPTQSIFFVPREIYSY